jgi:hypothetical protein
VGLSWRVDGAWSEIDAKLVALLSQKADHEDILEEFGRLKDENKLWIIPGERMKGKDGKAQAHAVPLTDDMLQILATLPRFKGGKFLFSTTYGKKPAWIGDKIKKKLDAEMLVTLKAMARRRGDDPAEVELRPWKNHDIRRTVRTNLSKLRISEEAREAVMPMSAPASRGRTICTIIWTRSAKR